MYNRPNTLRHSQLGLVFWCVDLLKTLRENLSYAPTIFFFNEFVIFLPSVSKMKAFAYDMKLLTVFLQTRWHYLV